MNAQQIFDHIIYLCFILFGWYNWLGFVVLFSVISGKNESQATVKTIKEMPFFLRKFVIIYFLHSNEDERVIRQKQQRIIYLEAIVVLAMGSICLGYGNFLLLSEYSAIDISYNFFVKNFWVILAILSDIFIFYYLASIIAKIKSYS